MAGDRAPPGEQLVEHDAERVEIAPLVDRPFVELLRRGIADLADEHAPRQAVAVVLQAPSEPEIDQLDERPALEIAGQHQVARRDVAVDDALAMEVLESERGLAGDLQRQGKRRRPEILQELAQRRALDVLQDDVGAAVVAEGEIVEQRHVGMAQPARGARLAEEPLLGLGRGLQGRADHLDDPQLVEQPVPHLVDRPHPPWPIFSRISYFSSKGSRNGMLVPLLQG